MADQNGNDSDSDGFPYSQFVKNLFTQRRARARGIGSPTMKRIIMETELSLTYEPRSPMDAFSLFKSRKPKYHLKFYYLLCFLAVFVILAYVTYLKYY